jgi:hypothetical protein
MLALAKSWALDLPKFEIDELREAITGNDFDMLKELINE